MVEGLGANELMESVEIDGNGILGLHLFLWNHFH